MKIYHGTGIKILDEIEELGYIKENSYFGDLNIAIEYAESHGDGVILTTILNKDDFKANMMLNNAEYESGDTDVILDENDLQESLSMYESVVSCSPIYDYKVISINEAKSIQFSISNMDYKKNLNDRRKKNRP